MNNIYNEGFCSKHKEYKNELFCLTENKTICYKCAYHDCSNHQKKEIEILKNEKKNIYISNIENLKLLTEKIKKEFEELKFEYEEKKRLKNKLIQDINIKFNELINFISELKSKLIIKIENFFNTNDYQNKINNLSQYSLKDITEEKNLKLKKWNELNINSMNKEILNIENDLKKINDIIKKKEKKKEQNLLSINESAFIKIINFIKESEFEFFIDNYLYFNFQKGENYELSKNGKIATKINGGNSWNCTIFGDTKLPKNKICKWKIRLNKFSMKSGNFWDICIGVGPYSKNNLNSYYNNCWSFICGCSKLSIKSGNEINYYFKEYKPLKEGDIIEITMNMKIGELSFSVNGINYGIASKNIPIDIELYPIVLINDLQESVEIL